MEKKKTSPDVLDLTGHLDELRSRILVSLGVLLVSTLAGLAVARPLIGLLKAPAAGIVTQFVLVRPTEAVSLYLKVSFAAGLIIALPFIVYQFWQFVRPALSEDLRSSAGWWVLPAAFSFGAGAAFAYAVLVPASIRFLFALAEEVALPLFNLDAYLSLVLAVILLGGVMFEMPVAAALLTRLGIISPQFLRRRRKEALFALAVAGAVVTPTTDLFNLLLFVLPMALLYEASIIVAALVYLPPLKDPVEEVYDHAR